MEPIKNRAMDGITGPNGQNGKPASMGAQPTSTDLVGDAKGLASKVVDQAHKAVDQAKDVVGDQVSEQQKKSAGSIDTVAKALHKTSEDLVDNVAGPYVEKVAGALDKMAGAVRTANVRDLVAKTERFARQDPLLFIGGAFAIGLVAARFLKSSARAEAEAHAPKQLAAGTMDSERGRDGDH